MDRGHWQPADIALVFLTCPREPSYLAATLASAFLGDPRVAKFAQISVSVDAETLECVGQLITHSSICWLCRTREESSLVEQFHLHRRACHNYAKALSLARPEARALMVCEDDILFRDGWVGMLLDALNEVSPNQQEFMLAAYSPRDNEAQNGPPGSYISGYPAEEFYGTQAMVFSKREASFVRDTIWKRGVERVDAPYDILIKERAMEIRNLVATRHSLVQHIGFISTGLGSYHQSPSFAREWPTGS